ncbi:MAG: glycoside hydrolase family 88 protein [Kiritimatiellae bacterium]|nr:glycoside hydrolase family 88 protein [Kiritimatiellia bacterium]
MASIDLNATARRCFDRATATQDFRDYTGILTLHGAARLAVLTEDAELLDRVRARLRAFVRGLCAVNGNFANYDCGGNGTAWLLMLGEFPDAEPAVRRHAELTVHDAPRDRNGILCAPFCPADEKIWIDVAFAVTPFLLFAGLALGEDRYIEEAWQQTAKMVRVFRDPANGLLHQSRNFNGPGNTSHDHWSRGNGWGLHALTELANYLPADDPRRPEAEALFTDLCASCLAVQDANGMFHQELPDPTSFVETSGTGLLLYAFGVGLERGLLGKPFRAALAKGLRGYLSYIAVDGAVHHTCQGCLCPGEGTVEDYKAKRWALNDPHAFGPVLLSFGQAIAVGIRQVEF